MTRQSEDRSQSLPANSQPAARDARTARIAGPARVLEDAGLFSTLTPDLMARDGAISAVIVDAHTKGQDSPGGPGKRVAVRVFAAEYLPQLAEGPCSVFTRCPFPPSCLHDCLLIQYEATQDRVRQSCGLDKRGALNFAFMG
jgi:hypothetical protein